MDRILAMSLVGAGPGNVFGPGMSAGALESFVARDAGRAKTEGEGNSRGGGAAAAAAAAGGTRSASAGSGGKCAAEPERTAEKEANGVGGQEGRAAGANVTLSCPAVDRRFCFDAVVAPY